MYVSKIKNRYKLHRKKQISQGDLLSGFDLTLGCAPKGERNIDILEAHLEYAVVMSQACDLDKDFKERAKKTASNDKYLQTILLCPAYTSEKFKTGEQIAGWEMERFNTKQVEKLINNYEYSRYHYLKRDDHMSIPDLVIDFKHFMTVPRDSLYKFRKKFYVGTLSELFREDLSQRFSSYLSRIGLPDLAEDKVPPN